MVSQSQSRGVRLATRCVGAILVAALASPGCRDAEPAVEAVPDIVLVVIDTLRPDHLSAYGYAQETAPYLARLAERSAVFERAFSSSSWTAPSTASIFTGRYPNQHGVVSGFRAMSSDAPVSSVPGSADSDGARVLRLVGLPEALDTLPQRLATAGYRTFGFTANINIGAELGFARGFDHFERLPRAESPELVERVLSSAVAHPDDAPSFLYLHLNDVHKPYRAHAPWFERQVDPLATWIAKYDSEISHLDQALGALAAELEWGPETVIMVVSDHGEEFMDHGDMGHKFSLHIELNRVLMMLHAPEAGVVPSRVLSNVSLVDVLPTLLELAQVDPRTADSESPGRSVMTLTGGVRDAFFDQRTLFAHRMRGDGEHLWAAIRAEWKLIENPGSGERWLFDLDLDAGELDDLSGEFPLVAEDFAQRLARFRAEFPIPEGQLVDVELDEELFKHLRDLGYVDDE